MRAPPRPLTRHLSLVTRLVNLAVFKQRLAIILLLLVIIFGAGLFAGFILPRWVAPSPPPKVYNTAALLEQVQTLAELVTVKYVIQKVVILEDPPQNPVRRMLPDETRVVLVAHGIVKAGVDLRQLKPGDLKVSGKKIVLHLPSSQITDAYLDEKQTQVVERNTSFLRDFNKDLEQTARQNALDDIRRAARSNGILKDADER